MNAYNTPTNLTKKDLKYNMRIKNEGLTAFL